jgi:uncharacterized protein
MTFTSSQRLDLPLDEVWRWFTSPGAMTRLTPPFMGMRVVREAENVRDGVAVLRPALPSPIPALPAPTWVATHDPLGYVEGRRFVDRVTSAPYQQLVDWEHEHEFDEVDGGARILDRVRARVPVAVLQSMFAFRRSRLEADLAALARARAFAGGRSLTVAVTGSSGLVGTQLCAFLGTAGHRVVRLVRGPAQGEGVRHWEPDRPSPDLLDDVDVLVHLAGSSIAGRFTAGHKRRLRDSRIVPTRKLAELVARRGGATSMVSASAVHFYGADRGDEVLDEGSRPGSGFLAEVVHEWEDACDPARETARVVNVRTGIVLSASGGMLGVLAPLFRAGLGGRLGTGRQWFAWIALDDLVDIYVRAICDESLSGAVNAAAPRIVRNSGFTRAMGRVLHRPTPLPVPDFAPVMVLGKDGYDELAAANQRMRPAQLEERGHHFRFPGLEEALRHELGREHRG